MGLAMAAAEDSTANPTAVTSEALAAAVGLTDQVAAELARNVNNVRDWYSAVAMPASPRMPPNVVLRRLRSIAKAARVGRLPSPRTYADPAVRAVLSQAAVDRLGQLHQEGRISREGQRGARRRPLQAIEKGHFAEIATFAARAIEEVEAAMAAARGRKGVHLGRRRDSRKSEAVARMALHYHHDTGRIPARGSPPFERFLQLVLGDLTGSSGAALAARWARYRAEKKTAQNDTRSACRAA